MISKSENKYIDLEPVTQRISIECRFFFVYLNAAIRINCQYIR